MSDDALSCIPACQRCKLGKRRCDRANPKCSLCTKANTACIIVDPVSSKRYARQYIGELQAREKDLLHRLGGDQGSQSRAADISPSRTPHGPRSAESMRTPNEYVGESSGLNFMRLIFAGSDCEAQRTQALGELCQRPRMPELNVLPNEAPAFDDAFALLNNYFSRFQIHQSFLLRDDVFATFEKVYSSDPVTTSPQDNFRLFMIFAISGVTRYRAGLLKDHPYGYYLSALRWIDEVPLLGNEAAVQNLLLIARFGTYYHVGISLWDIAQACMRQCIDLDYHRPPAVPVLPLEEQKRRRIFWGCYVLDRQSSAILGRPFAIADEDITVSLPVVANDEFIRSDAVEELSVLHDAPSEMPTEMSVFVFFIKLRRISSRIQCDFFNASRQRSRSSHSTPSTLAAAGHTHMKVHRYVQELESWRLEAPIFSEPSMLYERQEWYDFLLEKDKLVLLRGSIHWAPKQRNGMPSLHLLKLCIQSAAKSIELYANMFYRGHITWSRTYFQAIFSAGLSVVYCLSFGKKILDHLINVQPYWTALELCSDVLAHFKREMPDAGIFSIIFTEMKQRVARKSSAYTEPQGERTASMLSSGRDCLTGPLPHTYEPNVDDHAMQNYAFTDLEALSTGYTDLLFSDDMMQSIEAGLGEYACGFPGDDIFSSALPDFDFHNL